MTVKHAYLKLNLLGWHLWRLIHLQFLGRVYGFDGAAAFIVYKNASHTAEGVFITHLGQQGGDGNSFCIIVFTPPKAHQLWIPTMLWSHRKTQTDNNKQQKPAHQLETTCFLSNLLINGPYAKLGEAIQGPLYYCLLYYYYTSVFTIRTQTHYKRHICGLVV